MLDEIQKRRSDFRQGVPVQMGDGQVWQVPLPRMKFVPDPTTPDGVGVISTFGHEFQSLVNAAMKAGSGLATVAAEMAVYKFMLRLNYDLTDEDLGQLLVLDYGQPDPYPAPIDTLRDDLATIARGEYSLPKAPAPTAA